MRRVSIRSAWLEAIEEHDVEPASCFLLARKIVARRGDDPRLFARIDAVSGAPKALERAA